MLFYNNTLCFVEKFILFEKRMKTSVVNNHFCISIFPVLVIQIFCYINCYSFFKRPFVSQNYYSKIKNFIAAATIYSLVIIVSPLFDCLFSKENNAATEIFVPDNKNASKYLIPEGHLFIH